MRILRKSKRNPKILWLVAAVILTASVRMYSRYDPALSLPATASEPQFKVQQPSSTNVTTQKEILAKKQGGEELKSEAKKPPGPTKKKTIWSHARGDRSGAFIQDMLMCHAYAYHKGYIYGGACGRNTNLQFKPKHQELIDSIGLTNVLKFGCPPGKNTELQYRGDYINNDTGIFTEDYIANLQELIDYPTKPEKRRISVHMRRGDITPCRPRTRGYPRYLPNQHFLRLIDRYNPNNDSEVFVYSESESFENFDAFRERGYNVVLDGSIGDVWKGILVSDVVIPSRSSFSLVPSIMTKGKV
eukprot:CAMPEP_0176117324 /NCGR_PEP_ID=MMETSP0120_2-20121206/58940_1 /TAXON_ID=160619 /ORGANISM="Kryptoperidinium foliaceum, Strain CCMP 1326" /LENGTH=300 /DNA_ID=CAMNT_0017451613 /DNA_START=59 /DNA_END=958 /DNA_ORIENTATION=+